MIGGNQKPWKILKNYTSDSEMVVNILKNLAESDTVKTPIYEDEIRHGGKENI